MFRLGDCRGSSLELEEPFENWNSKHTYHIRGSEMLLRYFKRILRLRLAGPGRGAVPWGAMSVEIARLLTLWSKD